MFGSKKTEESQNGDRKKAGIQLSSSAINRLVKDTSVDGSIKSDSDFRIDGELIGKLDCKAKLIIGQTGKIDGEAHCKNAVIEGVFKGKLVVTEVLDIRASAKIDGDIKTNKLIVESGAMFNVNCNMGTAKSTHTASQKPSKEAISK